VLQEEGFKSARLWRSQRAARTEQLPDELIASGYKAFTFLVCPCSGSACFDRHPNFWLWVGLDSSAIAMPL
jgi:hypothetical protein